MTPGTRVLVNMGFDTWSEGTVVEVEGVYDMPSGSFFVHPDTTEKFFSVIRQISDKNITWKEIRRKRLPLQPIVKDQHGTVRFQGNTLVQYLRDHGGIDMNKLAVLPNIPRADREQFAQLIGYSLSGFADLDYVRNSTWVRVEKARKAQKL